MRKEKSEKYKKDFEGTRKKIENWEGVQKEHKLLSLVHGGEIILYVVYNGDYRYEERIAKNAFKKRIEFDISRTQRIIQNCGGIYL